MKKNYLKKYEAYLAPLLVALLAILTTGTFLKPKLARILEIQDSLNDRRQHLMTLEQKVRALEGLDKQELTQKTKTALKALPAEKDIPLVIAVLKAVAEEKEISLAVINTSPGEVASGAAAAKVLGDSVAVGFSVKANGDLVPLAESLMRLEAVLPLMRLTRASINREQENDYFASLELEVFFLDLPSEIGAAEKPLPIISAEERAAFEQLLTFKPVVGEAVMPSVPTGKENPFSL